jgi:hypothetical protein
MSRLGFTALAAVTIDTGGASLVAIWMFPDQLRTATSAIVRPLIWLWLRIPAPPLTLREPKPEPRHRLGHTGELPVVPPTTPPSAADLEIYVDLARIEADVTVLVAEPGFERHYLDEMVVEQPVKRHRGRHRHPDELDDTGMFPHITDDRKQVDA